MKHLDPFYPVDKIVPETIADAILNSTDFFFSQDWGDTKELCFDTLTSSMPDEEHRLWIVERGGAAASSVWPDTLMQTALMLGRIKNFATLRYGVPVCKVVAKQ